MAIIKIIDKEQKKPMMLKLKLICNKAILDITNNTREILIFDKKTMIGILDLRSLGYYCYVFMYCPYVLCFIDFLLVFFFSLKPNDPPV